jgi:DNA-binding winged helix-turn-helix (wHTH) protein/tetratricopeptide (TPR) repeat protein
MATTTHTFGPFRLDADAGILFRGSEPLPVGKRAVALLRVLVDRAGAPVSKDTLIDAAWSGLAVEESNLTVQIAALRRVLSLEPGGDKWIETLPRRGYRFVGAVTKGAPVTAADVPGSASASSPIATAHPEAVDHGRRRIEPERRQLTILCCELLLPARAALDPEDLRLIVKNYHQWAADTVDRFNGSIGSRVGTTVLAYFGYPAAHEDDAEQAIRAGLRLCNAVENLSSKLPRRVGIATGLVIAGEQAELGDAGARVVVGEAPSVADRLQALGQPGTVTIDGTTRRLIGDLFQCRDLATVNAETDEAFQVLGPSNVESRFEALHPIALSPLVGREEELLLLQRRWKLAIAGEGSVVLVCGEPGIGKSRITQALEDVVRDGLHVRLRYFCSPNHANSPLYPVIGQLEHAARLASEDPPEQKIAKLEDLIAPYAADKQRAVALLGSLLSLPIGTQMPELNPQERKEQTFAVFLEQLQGLAADHPTLVVFEDVHWLDPTSLELLTLIIERTPSLRLLLVATFRPEFAAPWAGLPHVTMLLLNRLAMRQCVLVIQHIAGRHALPRPLVEEIASRADGVPLFVEELTKAILETGATGDELGRIVAQSTAFAIPPTLHASLMARLDRVGPAKEIAQIGSVLGREFAYSMLISLADRSEMALKDALVQLERAELVFRRGQPPEAVYIFKHALVRDAAYDSLLRSRRKVLHRRIAETFLDRFPAIDKTEPEIVAHHFTQAGLGNAAAEWWCKAGDRAMQASAYNEAIAHLGKGLTLANEFDDAPPSRRLRLRLCTTYAYALFHGRGSSMPETAAAFERALQVAAAVDDITARFSAYFGMWSANFGRANLAPMREVAEVALRDVQHSPGSPETGMAHQLSGVTCWFSGDYVGARSHFEKALAAYGDNQDRRLALSLGLDARVVAMLRLSLVLWPLGDIDESTRLLVDGLSIARDTHHIPTIVWAQVYACQLASICRQPNKAKMLAEAVVGLAHEHDLPQRLADARFYLGWANWCGGDEAGESELRQALALRSRLHYRLYDPLFGALVAEQEAAVGRVETGIATLDAQISAAEQMGQRWFDAELYRIRGELILKLQPRDVVAAESAFVRAIEIAHSQKTRTLELRAALSLAKLHHAVGRDYGIRKLLAPALAGLKSDVAIPEVEDANRLLAMCTA